MRVFLGIVAIALAARGIFGVGVRVRHLGVPAGWNWLVWSGRQKVDFRWPAETKFINI